MWASGMAFTTDTSAVIVEVCDVTVFVSLLHNNAPFHILLYFDNRKPVHFFSAMNN